MHDPLQARKNWWGLTSDSDVEMMEFRILRGKTEANNRIILLEFRGADISLFRSLIERTPWATVVERRGI